MSSQDYDDDDDDFEYTYEEDAEEFEMEGMEEEQMEQIERMEGYKVTSDRIMSPAKGTSDDNRVLSVPDDGYVIRDCSEIRPLMHPLMAEVCGLLELPADVAQSLLQQHKWDKEKLIDNCFADSEKTLRDSGLNLYSTTITTSLANKMTNNNSNNNNNLLPS